MKSKWTSARDKRLLAQQAAGRTAAEIAKSLGVSRNAVIGRSRRLRGIVYRSDIESWARMRELYSLSFEEACGVWVRAIDRMLPQTPST